MPLIELTTTKSAMAGMNNGTVFADLREAGESDFQTLNTTSTQIIGPKFAKNSGRGGAVFQFQRAFFGYVFTGYGTAAGTMTNLKWNFTGTNATSGDVVVRLVKTSAFASDVTEDYANTDWWESLSLATTYNPSSGASATWEDGTAAQSFTLSSNATTAAQNDLVLKFAVMQSVNDFSNSSPAVDKADIVYVNNSVVSGVTRAYISFDWTAVSTGYANTVNAIVPASISKILGIVTDEIEKVNGV